MHLGTGANRNIASVATVYQPVHFAVDDPAVVLGLVRAASFGHLVVGSDVGPVSTPMPFVVDDELSTVRAHLAKPNDVWPLAPCDALLIVAGVDAFVSPNWYASKAEHGRVVPTWDYEVVHLHGRLTAHDDPAWLRDQLRAITDAQEAAMPEPWSIDDPPDGYIDKQFGRIIGIELSVRRIEAKRKLSQNIKIGDHAGVVNGLRDGGDDAAASAVETELSRRLEGTT